MVTFYGTFQLTFWKLITPRKYCIENGKYYWLSWIYCYLLSSFSIIYFLNYCDSRKYLKNFKQYNFDANNDQNVHQLQLSWKWNLKDSSVWFHILPSFDSSAKQNYRIFLTKSMAHLTGFHSCKYVCTNVKGTIFKRLWVSLSEFSAKRNPERFNQQFEQRPFLFIHLFGNESGSRSVKRTRIRSKCDRRDIKQSRRMASGRATQRRDLKGNFSVG